MHNAAMHLSDYMAKHDLTDAEVAEQIQRSQSTINRIRRRKVRPDWRTIEDLKSFSKGAITADDFVSLEAAQ